MMLGVHLLLLILLSCHYIYWANKNPSENFLEIILSHNRCRLVLKSKQEITYDRLSILIHNPWFILMQLQGPVKNMKLVLFQDQIPLDALRLLHIKAGMNYKIK
ncbi:MAG: hypothetical protein H0U75_01025 [Legionella sp.]|nr:hypothetical protein [Legionella sp.]